MHGMIIAGGDTKGYSTGLVPPSPPDPLLRLLYEDEDEGCAGLPFLLTSSLWSSRRELNGTNCPPSVNNEQIYNLSSRTIPSRPVSF